MFKFDQDAIIRSLKKAKSIFSHNCIFDLDLWPCQFDPVLPWLTFYWYQSYVNARSRSNHSFVIYGQNNIFILFHIRLWPLTLWPWRKSSMKIQLSVCDLYLKQMFAFWVFNLDLWPWDPYLMLHSMFYWCQSYV